MKALPVSVSFSMFMLWNGSGGGRCTSV